MDIRVARGHHVADHDAFASHQLTDGFSAEPMSEHRSSEDPHAEHEGGDEKPSRSADCC
jgi:hypothetical protein